MTMRHVMLYVIECWEVKKQHVSIMNVAEIRMLRWMCGKTRRDKIRNERICKMIKVAQIEEKMRENRLQWFGHIQRKPINAPVRKSDAIHIEGNARGIEMPKLTWVYIIKKDLLCCDLIDIMELDRAEWRNVIHVDDPK